jgi:cobalt-zinc-cadmium efflux system outer membrane protein
LERVTHTSTLWSTARGIGVVVLLAAGAFSAMPPALRAQERAPIEVLGVRDAIGLALERNPAVNRTRQGIAALEGEWWSGWGLESPRVSYMEEGIPDGQELGLPGFLERRWSVSQQVASPLASYYGLKRTSAEQGALGLALDAQGATLRAAVKRSYVELVYAREILHLREQEVELARDLDEAVRTRLEVGEAAEIDVMKAELQVAEAESNHAEATRQFQNTRYGLFNVVGLDPEEQRYEVAFPDTLVYVPVEITEDAVLAGIESAPDLLAAEGRVRAASMGVSAAWWSAFPSLQLQFFTQDLGTGFDFHGFQVGFSVPLWFPLNERGAVQQARAEERRRQWQQQETLLALKQQLEQTWHGYETSLAVIRRYSEDVNARADELLELTREGYLLGELDLLTLLDTQRTYLASRKRYWDALRGYYLHLIDLERFVGREIVFAGG